MQSIIIRQTAAYNDDTVRNSQSLMTQLCIYVYVIMYMSIVETRILNYMFIILR